MNTIILIPCYEPDNKLIDLIKKLHNAKCDIVLINDGSKNFDIFNEAKPYAKIISYNENKGKGYALKVGFSYALKLNKNVVTADADGQHSVEDILKVKKMLDGTSNTIIFGERTFDGDIPLRSSFGNKVTSKMLKFVSNISLRDTQTGLRGYSVDVLKKIIPIYGNRFDYEMNVILSLNELKINSKSTDISTIYIDENKSSHFRPIRDSMLVYKKFITYIFSSVIAGIIDYSLFLILSYGSYCTLFLSVLIPRIISSFINFMINKTIVFAKKGNIVSALIKYYILVVIMIYLNFVFTSLLSKYITLYLAKIIADLTLYVIGFFVQRNIVFKDK